MLIGLSKPLRFLTRYPIAKVTLPCLVLRHSLRSRTQAFFFFFNGLIPLRHSYPTSIAVQSSIWGTRPHPSELSGHPTTIVLSAPFSNGEIAVTEEHINFPCDHCDKPSGSHAGSPILV
jgi:hypothetical protein